MRMFIPWTESKSVVTVLKAVFPTTERTSSTLEFGTRHYLEHRHCKFQATALHALGAYITIATRRN